MSVITHEAGYEPISAAELKALSKLPVAIIGDELNRAQMMQAAIKPLAPGMGFAGQALTVSCMVGDNLALHHATALLEKGQVLVADARGHEDTAVWGGILHTAAKARSAAAIVIDGAMRDVAEIREAGLPAYARAIVPAGPHKGFGGEINAPIQCAGVAVRPGDVLVGDEDGVIVIRPEQLDGLIERCKARIASEVQVLAGLASGKTTVDLLGL